MRVYLSSTYADLKEHRRAVIDGLLRAGHEVRAMEYYPAADDQPKDFCIRDVATCDVYVGLFADRYGYIPPGDQLSIIEQEHNEAKRCLVPRLIFFARPDHHWPERLVDKGENAAKLRALKDKLSEDRVRLEFATPEELATKVLASLNTLTPGKRPLQHLSKRAIPFTGRTVELERLTTLIQPKLGEGAAVGIWGLRGEGGIGKTALAAELAERLADQFPGGVLWTNLLEERPASAALRWLHDYGEDTGQLKADEAPQECLDRLFAVARRRRPLIVLDNAWDQDRVKALLANNPGVVYVITTREQQHLPPGIQAERIVPMSTAEALDLLAHFAAQVVQAEPDVARQVCDQCGHLPVFLRVAGAAVESNEFPTFAEYSRELAARGLASIADFDQNAATIFELSWQRRTPQEREALLALALFPGGNCGANYLQTWLKIDATLARRLLIRLEKFSLIEPCPGSERYRMHDRQREFLLSKLGDPGDRRAELMQRTLECWTDWDFVESEFHALGINRLVAKYVSLDAMAETKPPAFVEWLHFIRGQAHVLGEHPELFFQEAFNQAKEGVVSRAAQERAAEGKCPERWLEWINRAKEFARPARLQVLTGHTACVNSVAMFDGGRRVVSGSDDKTVRVWDLETGTCGAVLEGHMECVLSVAVAAAPLRMVSGSHDKTVRVWDLETGACLAVLEGHTDSVRCVAVDGAGRRAISGSQDKTVRVWDLETGSCLAVLEGHTDSVRCVAVDGAGRRAVSGCAGLTVCAWDLNTRANIGVLEGHRSHIPNLRECLRFVAIDAIGGRAISASSDGEIRLWELCPHSPSCIATLKHEGVDSIAVDVESQTAMSALHGGVLRLWDLTSGERSATFVGHTLGTECLAMDHKARRAVSGSFDGSVWVWDLGTERMAGLLPSHSEAVMSVAVHSCGPWAVSGSYDTTVRVWDLATGRCVRTLEGHTDAVSVLALIREGSVAVSGSHDGTLRVWDLEKNECKHVLDDHTGQVFSLAVDSDGLRAVTVSGDRSARIWDLVTGACIATFSAHPNREFDKVKFEGTTVLAISCNDETLRLWDVFTGQTQVDVERESQEARELWEKFDSANHRPAYGSGLLTLEDCQGRSMIAPELAHHTAAACSTDGRRLIVGDRAGRVYIYRLRKRGEPLDA